MQKHEQDMDGENPYEIFNETSRESLATSTQSYEDGRNEENKEESGEAYLRKLKTKRDNKSTSERTAHIIAKNNQEEIFDTKTMAFCVVL